MKSITSSFLVMTITLNLVSAFSISEYNTAEIIGIVAGSAGLIFAGLRAGLMLTQAIRKSLRRKYTIKMQENVNKSYLDLKTDQKECENKLNEYLKEIETKFRKKKIDEVQFQLLKSEIMEKLRELREKSEESAVYETDTIAKKVKKKDVGKTIARMDKKTREKIGVSTGDVVTLVSSENNVDVEVASAYKEDINMNIVRIDADTRTKLKIEDGQLVKIRPKQMDVLQQARKIASSHIKEMKKVILDQNRLIKERMDKEQAELAKLRDEILSERKRLLEESERSDEKLQGLEKKEEQINTEMENRQKEVLKESEKLKESIHKRIEKRDTLLRDEARTLAMSYVSVLGSRLNSINLDYVPTDGGNWFNKRTWTVEFPPTHMSVTGKLKTQGKFGEKDKAILRSVIYWSKGFSKGVGVAEEISLEEILPEIKGIVSEANKNKIFYAKAYVSPTGWDRQALNYVSRFQNDRVSVYLVDLKKETIYFNSNDPKTLAFSELFDPKHIPKEFRSFRRLLVDLSRETKGYISVNRLTSVLNLPQDIVLNILDKFVKEGPAKWVKKKLQVFMPIVR